LQGIAQLGQGPFKVQTERVDVGNHVISVVTLDGHPLAGWRYWRVYSVDTNDIVIETAAVDTSGPGGKRSAGYWIFAGQVTAMWANYLRHILFDARNFDKNEVEGGNPFYNIITGIWGPAHPTQ